MDRRSVQTELPELIFDNQPNLIEALELIFEAADPEEIQRRLREEPYTTSVKVAFG